MFRASGALKGLGLAGLFLSLFGALWMVEALNTFTWIWIVCCVLVPTVLLVMRSIGLLLASREAQAAEPPETPEDARARRNMGRHFAWIFLAEFGAIAVAANVLGATGHADWILAAISVIVGLHFLPLARIFRFPLYYATGGVEVGASLALAWLARGRITAADPVFGLIMGLSLWLTVILVLTQGGRLASRISRVPAGSA